MTESVDRRWAVEVVLDTDATEAGRIKASLEWQLERITALRTHAGTVLQVMPAIVTEPEAGLDEIVLRWIVHAPNADEAANQATGFLRELARGLQPLDKPIRAMRVRPASSAD